MKVYDIADDIKKLSFSILIICFRYKSKFASKVREAFHHGRYDHHTMGEAHYEPPAPNEFLRKNARQGIFNKRVKSARGHRKYNFNSVLILCDLF